MYGSYVYWPRRRSAMAELADKNDGNENQDLTKKKVSSYEDRPLRKKLGDLADELEPDPTDKGFESEEDEEEDDWDLNWSESVKRHFRGEIATYGESGKNEGNENQDIARKKFAAIAKDSDDGSHKGKPPFAEVTYSNGEFHIRVTEGANGRSWEFRNLDLDECKDDVKRFFPKTRFRFIYSDRAAAQRAMSEARV